MDPNILDSCEVGAYGPYLCSMMTERGLFVGDLVHRSGGVVSRRVLKRVLSSSSCGS